MYLYCDASYIRDMCIDILPKDMPRFAFSTAELAPTMYHFRVLTSLGMIGTGKLTVVR